MKTKERLSLALPTEPRDSTISKDSLLSNCYIDKDDSGTIYTTKRPGFLVGLEGITTSDRGIFYNPGTGSTYYINGTAAAISPSFWNSSSSYNTNDQVTWDGITYTAIQNSVGQRPSSTSTYWATTPVVFGTWVNRVQTFNGYYTKNSLLYAWIINGTDADFYSTSDLGITWTYQTTLTNAIPFAQGTIRSFVEIGSTLYVWYLDTAIRFRSTTDGITWSAGTSTNLQNYDSIVSFSSNYYGLLSGSNTIYKFSGTPISGWTPTETLAFTYTTASQVGIPFPLVFNSKLYYLRAQSGSNKYIETSNGTSWTETNNGSIIDYSPYLFKNNTVIYNSNLTNIPNSNGIDDVWQATDINTWIEQIVVNPNPIPSNLISTGTNLWAYTPASNLYFFQPT